MYQFSLYHGRETCQFLGLYNSDGRSLFTSVFKLVLDMSHFFKNKLQSTFQAYLNQPLFHNSKICFKERRLKFVQTWLMSCS